ncbi:PREDICTED: receptor-binding cancer antigen expressed on SiSo cells [Dufourea novaeangliae]|uniref:receptor-binding cancer antigen expressed on SiSo cells n=1 Tax=Dufourea novaeangliae TaxID=178035 RepID=UPI00076783D1|nr:PREDICTED: receptor-binding cancer antigen expressed on SiSo cells [Dufourea novaeangliae]
MAMEFLVNRLKALVVLILGILRQAMCCLRRRRRSSCDSIPLSAVGVVPNTANNTTESEQWDQWVENPVVVVPDRPVNTIQAKIEQYRQHVSKPDDSTEEVLPNFFEDMTPQITRQTKILVKDKNSENASRNSSKFAVVSDPIPSNELGEWEDNAVGWEEETSKEFGDPTKTLREQKRREREQRLFEQQQKRIERNSRPQPLGAKLTS